MFLKASTFFSPRYSIPVLNSTKFGFVSRSFILWIKVLSNITARETSYSELESKIFYQGKKRILHTPP